LYARFQDLSATLPVFPSLFESYRECHKLSVIRDLDNIAREVTNTARPLTSRHRDAVDGEYIIVKRNASAYSDHVKALKPGQRPPALYSSHHYYFYQEYVPSFFDSGEIRVFIVNGNQVIHRIGTICDNPQHLKQSRYWSVETILPLEVYDQHTRVYLFYPLFLITPKLYRPPRFCHEDTNTQSPKGIEQIDHFAVQTLQALIKRERQLGITKSSLQCLARMDISCLYTPTGAWQFFVNEVTRFPALNMWLNEMPDFVQDKVKEVIVNNLLDIAERSPLA
jgi:hypothetical protein